MQLLKIQEELNGIYASAEVNLFGYIVGYAAYQDLDGDRHKSMFARLVRRLGWEKLWRKWLVLPDVRGYYIQNNVYRILGSGKTPSTVMGVNVGYNYKGAVFGIDYRWTFQDLNGDGLIRTSEESIKNNQF